MREAALQDRYLRSLIWLSEVEPKVVTCWIDDRFPGLSDDSLYLPTYVDFMYFMHNFVYPAMIERFVPWFMRHWPYVRGMARVQNDLEFPKSGTAMITFWRSDIGQVLPTGQPTHTGSIVLRDDRVFDPDGDHLYTILEYLQLWEKGQCLTDSAMRIIYVAEKPSLQ